MDLGISQVDSESAKTLTVRGVEILVKPIQNYITIQSQAIAIMQEKAIHTEWVALDSNMQRMYIGLALHRHYVENISSYTLKDNVTDETIEVVFDKSTDHADFETMGEQVLALDESTQERVLNFALTESNFRRNVEIVAMGNSPEQ